jgi:hypothetical protein
MIDRSHSAGFSLGMIDHERMNVYEPSTPLRKGAPKSADPFNR